MVAQREIPWEALRKSFIEAKVRPTYEELSQEYGVPKSTIGRCASDESWVTLRAEYLEKKAKECDALAVVIEAAQSDRILSREVVDYALVSLRGIKAAVESEEMADYKPSTRLQCHNTANFALANLAKALHDMGVVGMSKAIRAGTKGEDGKFDPSILQQINVTVQNLTAKEEAKRAVAHEVKEVKAEESGAGNQTPTPPAG